MALCGALFAAQLASAQQNMVLMGSNGEVNANRVSTVNYATFNTNDELFTITNDGIEGAKTLDTAPVDNSKTINGHKFVDLGLPSGLLWAETNIGAEKPTDDGNFYAFGETEPKTTYNWSTYKHGTSLSNLTKYNSSDGKTTLDQEDDAAYVNWGSSCRIPTDAEFAELLNANNCTWTWASITTSDGSSINGYKVTSLKNSNFIFLPASGYRDYGDLYVHGSFGFYWSSSLSSSYSGYACYLYFGSSDYYQDYYYFCDSGHPVRPVAEP